MQTLQKEQIASLARKKASRQKLSIADVSRATGLSKTNASFMLREDEKWKDAVISDAQWQLMARWIDYKVIVRTKTYLKIHNMCHDAQEESITLAIAGKQGTGKTFALRDYADRNPKFCYYLECATYFGKKVFINKLKKALGMDSPTSTADLAMDEIGEYLSTRRGKVLLILDEVGDLPEGSFKLLKDLYNMTADAEVGFILCGGQSLKKRIKRGYDAARQTYQEIYSRMGGDFHPTYEADNKSVEDLCIAWGVNEREAIKAVQDHAQGDYRRAIRMIHKVNLKNKKNGREIQQLTLQEV